ncbi:MAG: hypothetical protein DHS20C15_19050 [Planctomycetota bacterium]|nr:MAG: hypothetical protein DHS20C15_19050 [Planctomycetota bacterium]
MTGFGRAQLEASGVRVSVELRSVNARGLSLRCRLPAEWSAQEARLERELRKHLARGSVDLTARVERAGPAPAPRIDRNVLAHYRRELDKLGTPAVDGGNLLRLPGVVSVKEPKLSSTQVERLMLAALREALQALLDSRSREGARLARVMRRERTVLARQRVAVSRSAPRVVRQAHDSMRRRLDQLLGDAKVPSDDPTLLREVAVLADRSDVTEELDRLASHEQAFDELLAREAPVGRELDFLLQEMGRELNTLGSKSGEVSITQRVIAMKSAVDRLREQAANIQ